MLSQIFFLLACVVLSSEARKRDVEDLVSGFSRMVVLTSDVNLGVNGTPPNTQQLIAAVLDPNHAQMISSGLYTQAQVDAFVSTANAYFLVNFNINASAGQTINGITYIPSAAAPLFAYVPYAAQNVVNVAFDSTNLNRGAAGGWVGSQFGVVIACTTNLQFSGGTHAGETCGAGNTVAYFQYNLLKSGSPSNGNSREVLQVQTPWVSLDVVNSQGYIDSLSKAQAIDQQANVGFYMENIVWNKDVATNIVTGATRVVITWA